MSKRLIKTLSSYALGPLHIRQSLLLADLWSGWSDWSGECKRRLRRRKCLAETAEDGSLHCRGRKTQRRKCEPDDDTRSGRNLAGNGNVPHQSSTRKPKPTTLKGVGTISTSERTTAFTATTSSTNEDKLEVKGKRQKLYIRNKKMFVLIKNRYRPSFKSLKSWCRTQEERDCGSCFIRNLDSCSGHTHSLLADLQKAQAAAAALLYFLLWCCTNQQRSGRQKWFHPDIDQVGDFG